MPKTAFVIGGTGLVGSAIVRRMAEHGWAVTAASRGQRDPAGFAESSVRRVRVDRDETSVLRSALGDGVDVLVDVVPFTATHAEQLLELRELCGSIVAISSAAVYTDRDGRTFDEAETPETFPRFRIPIDEREPTVPPGDGTYATRKAAVERILLADDEARATLVRPGAIHGPGDRASREWFFVKRALDRRPAVVLAYRGQSRFHPTAAENLAELVRLAAERPGRRVLNCADPEPPTALEIGRTIAAVLDHEFTEVLLPGPPADGVGGHPWAIPAPLVLDMAEAEIVLGYRPVMSYARAVRQTCEWLVEATIGRAWDETLPNAARHYADLFDYTREDAFLRGLTGG